MQNRIRTEARGTEYLGDLETCYSWVSGVALSNSQGEGGAWTVSPSTMRGTSLLFGRCGPYLPTSLLGVLSA